jgi:hypothetical protein
LSSQEKEKYKIKMDLIVGLRLLKMTRWFGFQVLSFVGLEELYYAGSHGMDIQGPTNAAASKVIRRGTE